MTEPADGGDSTDEPKLTPPDLETAQQITREVSWEERLEGRLYISGPGDMTQGLYSLSSVSNFLQAGDQFAVNYAHLEEWVRDTLGDPELAQAIDEASEADAERAAINELLHLRLSQCRDVLDHD